MAVSKKAIPSLNRTKSGPQALKTFYETRNALATLQVFQEEVGDIFQLTLPGFKPIIVAGPEATHAVLATQRQQFSWRPEGDPVARLLRQGLLVVDGELHDELRKSMLPALQKWQLSNYIDSMWQCTDQVTLRWKDGGTFDMLIEMRRAALLIFMQTLFNVDFTPDLDRLWPSILRLLTYISPGVWIFLPGKPRPGFAQAIHQIDEYLYEIIRRRRNGEGVSGDLLSLLVSVPGMDDGLVRDQLLTMLIAGHDTSTALLTWVLYLLGTNPLALEQVRAEVDIILKGEPPTEQHLEQLPFMEQVLFETLRIYPPIHTGMRFTTSEVDLLGCTIPPQSRLMYSVYLTQHMERYWPEAERFIPERFCPEQKRGRLPYTYLPFGGGPRNCIGSAYAQVEVKVVLARLLQTFDFSWDPKSVHPHMGATLEPRPGVPMKVKPRKG
jgi:cytochrome P450